MVKTYPQDYFERKLQRLKRIIIGGVLLAFICMLVGLAKNEATILLCTLGIIVAVVFVVFLERHRAQQFAWSGGNVLEVKDGKVLYRHEKPFVYKKTCMTDKELVPMEFGKSVSVARTFHIALCNKILSYTLICTVKVIDSQKFYDMFLDPRKRYILSPEKVLKTCVATFLNTIRGRVIELYQDAAFSGERLNEHVSMTTMRDAEVYLQDELAAYGLLVCEARPISSLNPIIIE